MPVPAYFYNPFSHDRITAYRTSDIFNRLTANDLIIVPFKNIEIREFDPDNIWTHTYPTKKALADIRYPIIVYKSKLDVLGNVNAKEYSIFDGQHRLLKMKEQNISACVAFLLTPNTFFGLRQHKELGGDNIDQPCWSCEE